MYNIIRMNILGNALGADNPFNIQIKTFFTSIKPNKNLEGLNLYGLCTCGLAKKIVYIL